MQLTIKGGETIQLVPGAKKIDMKINLYSYYDPQVSEMFSGENACSTIRHEMRHVWQMVIGQLLVDNEKGFITYKGETFNRSRMRKLGYMNYPWEVDARSFASYAAKVGKEAA